MQSLKTSGIVLKGTNFGEADRILTILTERLGKVKVLAKGIRKIKSHLAGSLEPFMVVDLQLCEGKTFYHITGASIVNDFPNLHSDLQKMAQAFFLGEMADKFLPEGERVSEAFFLLSKALFSLESSSRLLMIRAFQLKILETSGFKPELYSCVHCKEKITPGNNFWDSVEGGIICKNCQGEIHHGMEIKDETIKLFRFIEQNEFNNIDRLKLSRESEEEAENLLSNYLKNILERELKSEKFLKML
jgi:DNA repair protein RecO (recombination protein O)